jgi:aspartate/tyrosine/aromatic aminotransferase
MFFEEISEAAPDPIFGMMSAFEADVRPNKISLMVGVFKDENLKSELMPVVKSVKSQTLALDETADYLPIDGYAPFCSAVGALVFGAARWEQHHSRIYAAQTVGGTSALRLGAEFLAEQVGKKMYIPQPTWGNHRNIFEHAHLDVASIPYYSHELHQVDAGAYLKAIEALEPKSILLLHACCHNPTGSDPSFEVWKQISDLCKKKSILPFFDFAYQGLGQGIDEDAKIVRFFLEEGHEFLVAYSCSKNFSLYCQRVGALFGVCSNTAVKLRAGSQAKRLIRALYSNPPAHGAKIVAHILKNRDLREDWENQLSSMRKRVLFVREMLVQKLMAKSKKKDFSFLRGHNGMFSYLDLNKSQVQELIDRYALYTLDSGRISIAGITKENIDSIVERIIAVCEP